MGRYSKKSEQEAQNNEAPQFIPPLEQVENEEQEAQNNEKSQRIIPLIASEDVVLHKGGVLVPTVIKLTGFEGAIVMSTQDNAINGLLVEDNKRLTSSFVVPMSIMADSEVNVVVNVVDEVNILRQTQYGTRMDNLIIPAGTHIADLVLL